ncbi:hypothetical protein CDO52_02390 [Nocardiopsis gilva YIM 90087]|uniref:Carbamoyltransferase n=1 Tax=Nocardiopsis gilva YIM 90087 TaxID=1235441 RepID=A0A223S189_9ACTN|nr:carbamoyltransferase [Nocardiopsis gilva]ASU81789.1 hypothetical protein CDO52_02390 [Nocardiopsis gilva YIM 90087]
MSDLVLGISAFYHDSAAALVDGGTVVAAAQEERFSRRRHDPSFPHGAVGYCLEEAGVKLDDLDAVAYYEDSSLKFQRILRTYAGIAPRGFGSFRRVIPEWAGWKSRAVDTVREQLTAMDLGAVPRIDVFTHHASHAASAFLPSPYESAVVLCVDGVGEWTTTSIWRGAADRAEPVKPVAELRFPHSLGMLYSAFTHFCGFKVDSGEYKVMGLAPYGEPRFADVIRDRLVDMRPDGSFRLNMAYFEFHYGEVMTGRAFEEVFGGPRREPEGPLTQREFDLAASVQEVTEDIMLRLARAARTMTGESRLCLAGGVALNCVANGRIVEDGTFDEVWVQPAAGDAGGALGAALLSSHARGRDRPHVAHGRDAMRGAFLGPEYDSERIQAYLDRNGYPYERLGSDDLSRRVARDLAEGKVVGWFQGRMEFGPRALGARSILGDARSPDMQSVMNLKIKFRESFRPFAPIVLEEDAEEYFDIRQPSPYMLVVSNVSEEQRLNIDEPEDADIRERLHTVRSTIPAVTHVDMSARVQTVGSAENPMVHRLLTDFKALTGVPVLVNTSFNVRGEPIVASPEDAYRCFMRTDIDVLALGEFLLEKGAQPEWSEESNWRSEIPLD